MHYAAATMERFWKRETPFALQKPAAFWVEGGGEAKGTLSVHRQSQKQKTVTKIFDKNKPNGGNLFGKKALIGLF